MSSAAANAASTVFELIQAVVITVTAVFIAAQLREARRTRHDQLVLARLDTYSRVTAKMVEIDQFLIQYPHLRPFLYDGVPLPGERALRSQVLTLAEWFCDLMEEVSVHEDLVENSLQTLGSEKAGEPMFSVWNCLLCINRPEQPGRAGAYPELRRGVPGPVRDGPLRLDDRPRPAPHLRILRFAHVAEPA